MNNQNLCVLCYDWFQKCQEQSQANLQYHQQNVANHKELIDIHNNLSNGIYVDQNSMMRALIGSMINLMNQTTQVASLKEDLNILENRQKEVEDDVSENKVKIYSLNYDFKQLDEKTSHFVKEQRSSFSSPLALKPPPPVKNTLLIVRAQLFFFRIVLFIFISKVYQYKALRWVDTDKLQIIMDNKYCV